MSNPSGSGQLRLFEEHRQVEHAIRAARHRDQIELCLGSAPRHRDLSELLQLHHPTLVHYAGHGGPEGIILVDDSGQARPVRPDTLTELFGIFRGAIECVVLNACLTEEQAAAIAAHVPCVVGMSGRVLDRAAIEFAAGFHQALANGESITTAFYAARHRSGQCGMDRDAPRLIDVSGVADRLFITGDA